MKRLVVAGMVGLAALLGPQANESAMAFSLFGHKAPQYTPTNSLPVQQVQQAASDNTVQIQQLEDEIRQLNGRIEDMSYQLLQMQETIRKAQQDNEFRFQELEKKRSDASTPGQSSPAVASRQPSSTDNVGAIIDGSTTNPPAASRQANNDAPGPTTLGSIDMDSNGNPIGATLNGTTGDNGAGRAGAGGAPTTAPTTANDTASVGSEKDLYQVAYSHVLSGDYKAAEGEFKDYITRYPKSARAADASFWLGEAQYSQERYKDAAETFLKAYQTHGKSSKGPEILLKLGMSLAALGNKDTACATLREVNKRYPDASKAVQSKSASEQKRLACG
ncbi:tol-pal system protein YbgF [Allorhizobium terrae]|uniref:Cell division coordinator CpoB n=1 Tax=Allorhizobium terrae TaxID=1848972 RepID=A0A4S4A532_9HYPH|nr:tol-pal system protein YbgF [Allorhizobium terrae]THF53585.1 tol-pal system protein YbgF [Allorhizobium terrae]TWD54133.1 tol-pal system protein YbgF [Agrobacterium vitis]